MCKNINKNALTWNRVNLSNVFIIPFFAVMSLFYSFHDNKAIAQIGIITTVAGNGTIVAGLGDGGQATDAELGGFGVFLNSTGNIFIADIGNDRIRKVDAGTGIITTVAGGGRPSDRIGDGGLATEAMLNNPSGVSVDIFGNIFIADSDNHRIRKVDSSTGIITTVVGGNIPGVKDLGDGGFATDAVLRRPFGLFVDRFSNIFIADTNNHRIRRVDGKTGIITTVAGNNPALFFEDGKPATMDNRLNSPLGVSVDSSGNIFIADSANSRILKVDGDTGIITTVAGTGNIKFLFAGDDGPAIEAELRVPGGVFVDDLGNIFIADTENHRIRKVDGETGIITTVAGSGDTNASFTGDGGLAIKATLRRPSGVFVDKSGNIFIADGFGIRKVSFDLDVLPTPIPTPLATATSGIITTVAGNGNFGIHGDGGFAIEAQLARPQGVFVDNSGNIFIADTESSRIRKVDGITGIITTVAGRLPPDDFNVSTPNGDGGPATNAFLSRPKGVFVDIFGNVFIADSDSIRNVNGQTGIITTVAGGGPLLVPCLKSF